VDLTQLAGAILDPSRLLRGLGMTPDPWQKQVMLCPHRQILLNCCRQSGKSTITAATALHQSLFTPKSLTLLLSPTERQSGEIFRKVVDFYRGLKRPLKTVKQTERTIEFVNGSRIVALPGKEETLRGYSGVNLLVIDEASLVPDDLYYSVRPMLSVSKGRLIALSTPRGKRGWFYREFTGSNDFHRVTITWQDCPRLDQETIDADLRSMGQLWVDQEYLCLFTVMEGLVYPEFAQTYIDFWQPPAGRALGGIDWGWRNPFAAIWGWHDKRNDILYINAERYLRETILSEHVAYLKKLGQVQWYADPAGADQLNEARAGGLSIIKGNNDIQLGIAAVNARIRTGRLKVNRLACPNLCNEAGMYRYPNESERAVLGEKPIDSDNHALGALRYLISRLDHHFISKLRKKPPADVGAPYPLPKDFEARERIKEYQQDHPARPWNRLDNPALWPSAN
jgi:hypothetical protein